MVVDRANGKFICQRQFPIMATVKPRLEIKDRRALLFDDHRSGSVALVTALSLSVGAGANAEARATAAGQRPLLIAPQHGSATTADGAGEKMEVTCVKAKCEAVLCSAKADAWFDSLLQQADAARKAKRRAGRVEEEPYLDKDEEAARDHDLLKKKKQQQQQQPASNQTKPNTLPAGLRTFALVEQTDAVRPRRVLDDARMAAQCHGRAQPDDPTAFGDHASFLLIGTASLRELNRRLAARGRATVGMERFRPNIVVETQFAHEEDTWKRIRIGGLHEFEVLKLCTRCQLPTVDQESGTFDPKYEPMKTLKTYRLDGASGVNLGVHLRYAGPRYAGSNPAATAAPRTDGQASSAAHGNGVLRIGEVVDILETVDRTANVPGTEQ